MTLTVWLVIAVVCVVAGIVLLVLDRRRRRAEPSESSPPEVGEDGGKPDEPAPEPGSLFRPNTPP